MVKMFKKLVCTVLLMGGVLLSGTAAAKTVDGDSCFSYSVTNNAKYHCSELFDGEGMTIREIYARGYRVVSMETTLKNLMIVIEKQD